MFTFIDLGEHDNKQESNLIEVVILRLEAMKLVLELP